MSRQMTVFLLAVTLFGIALRFWNVVFDQSLWLDEVFSAKMAESPLADLLLAVPRFDTHPPLYYIQLHFWALLGSGDAWLILNSVLWDALALLSLYHVVSRVYDHSTGLWAAAVYSVLPLAVFFAHNVRMYTLFFLLALWLWYLLEQRVMKGQSSGKQRIGTLLLGTAANLTHGMGFFVVFFLYLQAISRSHARHRACVGLRPAALIALDYLPVAIAAGYSLGIGLFRQTEGLGALDLDILGIHLTITLFGFESPAPNIIGYVGFVLILLPPLGDRRARCPLLWLVLLPFAVLLLLSLTIKSVFMYRTMGLFLPFVAITLGSFYATLWRDPAPWRRLLSVTYLGVFAVASLNSSLNFRKEGYREIAAIWVAHAETDAVLFVNGPANLWGITRYLNAVPLYSALDIQPPVRDGMLRLKRLLQGSYFDRAGLFGKNDHLVLGARQIWPYPNDKMLHGLPTYWVLDPDGGTCVQTDYQILRTFNANGHVLIQCYAALVQN